MSRRRSSTAPKKRGRFSVLAARRRGHRYRVTPETSLGLGFVALALLLAFFRLVDPPEPPEAIVGQVTHVRDGDTIEIGVVVIRIAALDCPELGTPAGAQASAQMQELVAGRQLRCTDLGPDRYGRRLAQCAVIDDPLTLSEHMVARGVCSYWGRG